MHFSHLFVLADACLLAAATSNSLLCTSLPDLPAAITKTPGALLELQRETTAIWAQAYADKDVDTLLAYTMEPYIQHNPGAPSGKAIAAAGLKQILSAPNLVNNVTRTISDLDYVALHVHRQQPGTLDKAIVDIFRLNGTCITEHWDVQQVMYPNATNPLAYF
ncbi:hypothetical protein DIS24_g11439 [Lasiodiplodia hormozganensis]|uniref:SnoaL-like domain-containing protein n=1 Tax=Lasiodiplodia hormozganensis TaxID=869390 RepID=A0AA40C0R8_9PEZI|nr:hypothetical protein DIS24_g11439 [Lasiodiplodia hormozganensis]